MTPIEIHNLLEKMGIRSEMGPLGFPLGSRIESGDLVYYRVEPCSGIGRPGQWKLVAVGSGESSVSCGSIRNLKRVIAEWMAGPKPFPVEGYVRMHRTRFGESYQWIRAKGKSLRGFR